MAKPKDLSPKFKIPVAEKELEILPGQQMMGSRRGGLSLFSDSFKRGYGNAVFGSDSNGIWLGNADFASAPFRVDMDGALSAKSATFTDDNNTTIIDSTGLVSTANFIHDQTGVLDGTNTTTTSTTLVDMNGMTLDAFSINRDMLILVLLTVRVFNFGGNPMVVHIYIGGDVADVQEVAIQTASENYVTLTTHNFRTITATSPPTSYTIKAKWSVSGGTGWATRRQISYMKFGT